MYSCGDNKIVMHQEDGKLSVNIDTITKDWNKNKISEAIEIQENENRSPETDETAGTEKIEKQSLKNDDISKRSEFGFEPGHYRFLVIGNNDGSVEIYSMPKFKLICILKSFHKLIQVPIFKNIFLASVYFDKLWQGFI